MSIPLPTGRYRPRNPELAPGPWLGRILHNLKMIERANDPNEPNIRWKMEIKGLENVSKPSTRRK